MLSLSVAQASPDLVGWWNDADVQHDLGLTTSQIGLLEKSFRESLPERKKLNRELMDLEGRLQVAFRDGELDEAAFRRLVEQVESTRARRNVYRTMTLYRMHKILDRRQRSALRQRVATGP